MEILLADDDMACRQFLSLALEHLGHTVTAASSGREVLDMLGTLEFDAVFLDWEMPDLAGADVLLRYREHPTRSRTAVYAYSAHLDLLKSPDYQRAGFDGFLPKPFHLEDLQRILAGLPGGPSVDFAIFQNYRQLLSGAGRNVDASVTRILGSVRQWLTSRPTPSAQDAKHLLTMAASCDVLGASGVSASLRRLSTLCATGGDLAWEEDLSRLGSLLDKTERILLTS